MTTINGENVETMDRTRAEIAAKLCPDQIAANESELVWTPYVSAEIKEVLFNGLKEYNKNK